MGIDPLSSATRTAKRNLLLVSIAIITIKTFNVTIEQIPLSTLSIKFDPGALGFLLSISLFYFMLTFVLYYYIDVKNFDDTPHQHATNLLMDTGPRKFLSTLSNSIIERLTQHMSPYTVDTSYTYSEQLSQYVSPYQIVGIGMSRQMPFSLVHDMKERGRSFATKLGRAQEPAAYSKADKFLAQTTKFFWWRLWMNRLYYKIRLRSVRFAYVLRNYIVDFIMVVAVALCALLALFGYIDMEWLRQYSPILKGTQ